MLRDALLREFNAPTDPASKAARHLEGMRALAEGAEERARGAEARSEARARVAEARAEAAEARERRGFRWSVALAVARPVVGVVLRFVG